MNTFLKLLRSAQDEAKSRACVGLDPVVERLPDELQRLDDRVKAVLRFNEAIVRATSPYISAYKINFAFYEALGPRGMAAVKQTRELIPEGIVTIADAKRGDIGHSAAFYAQSIFEEMSFDSCTVSPYLGRESVAPFLSYDDRGTFILARTSNAGSDAVQNFRQSGKQLFVHVAEMAHKWNEDAPGSAGLVTGGTYPDDLQKVRESAPGLPLLVPGIGAQGGDVGRVMMAAGDSPLIITSSRSILYAHEGGSLDEAAEAAGRAAKALRDRINEPN